MKTLPRFLTLAATAGLITFAAHQAQAQRGNFDPEEFRTRMMERFRERLKVESDDEWKIIEGRISTVLEARRDLASLTVGGRGFGFGGRGGPGGGGRGPRGGDDAQAAGGGRRGGRGGLPGFGGEPAPQVQALEEAVDSGSADKIKSSLAAFRAARAEKEAKLTKAQASLGEVLSVEQEGTCVLMGLVQ